MTNEEAVNRQRHWTVDKSIPLAVIFAIIAQTGGAVWYVRGLTADVEATKEAIKVLNTSDEEQTRSIGALADRTTRVEVDYSTTKIEVFRRLGVIDTKLDRIIERLPPPRPG